MTQWMELLDCLPKAPDYAFDFERIARTAAGSLIAQMAGTQQNPVWHGEGDVWTHTKMVCNALAGLPQFREMPKAQQQTLALAALLHDIGKIPSTRLEDGRWTSPGHSVSGARMAREMLISEFGLSGTREKQQMREGVCALIRYHMLPPYVLEREDPVRLVRRAAANGQLIDHFCMRSLCLLSAADVIGRIADDTQRQLDDIRLCAEAAQEAGCLCGPAAFASDHTQHAYLNGRSVLPEQALYDDTWGEVVMVCGLPGTGKDTYIAKRFAHLPMLSLDDVRRRMGVLPTADQGAVAQAAKEEARRYLRAGEPFVFNATLVTASMRGSWAGLFESYGASVRMVFLETGWEENLRRNAGRPAAVPEAAVGKMLRSLVPPERFEARAVEWICV